MIEVESNKIKCELSEYTPETKSERQEAMFQEVAKQVHLAHQMVEEYKREFGTDKRGIDRLLKKLNGG